MKVSRRNFLQASGATALAFSAGLPLSRRALAQRTNELNIYCWEGYNSDDVLDPFRREFDASVRAEGLTSDPDAVNRLRAGENKVWDILNVNNPWAREILFPENLIKPLPREKFEPYFELMMDEFKPPYHWAMDKSGEHLLGMTQRFGPFSFVVNTDVVSRDMAEDQGFNLYLDPKMKGRYGVLTYDNWNIIHMCMTAGFSPFREHSDDEKAAFEKVANDIFQNAKILTDDLMQMNLAMVNGEIDCYFTGGTYTASPARFDGLTNVRGITPRSGPEELGNKSGVVWIDLTSLVNNPNPSALGEAFLSYVQRPEVCKAVAFAEGTYNPVTQMGNPAVMEQFSAEELDAIQWDTLKEEMERSVDYDIVGDYQDLYQIYSAAKRARG